MNRTRGISRLWGAATGLAMALLLLAAPARATMDMIALDVGEGQAILFEKNGHGLLVDTGPVHRAAELVQDIREYGVRQLDELILTHIHPDHASGLFRVLEAWPGIQILENGKRIAAGRTTDLQRWIVQTMEAHSRMKVVRAGDTISWRGARIRFLWPEQVSEGGLNHTSLVLSLSHEGRRVLIMGDVGTEVERRLLERDVLPEDVRVLVAGHHASKHTSSAEFLKHVSPTHSIIAIDENNIRGYPHQDTVKRLEKYSEQLHRTWNGDAVLSLE